MLVSLSTTGFHVYDKATLLDIEGAAVEIWDNYGHGTLGYTDSSGRVTFETSWTPSKYRVNAEGYEERTGDAAPGVTLPCPMTPIDGGNGALVSSSFHVYDSVTTDNVAGALVEVWDGYGNSFSGLTDATGCVFFETEWVPTDYRATAGGYGEKTGMVVIGVMMQVPLTPIIPEYNVYIFSRPSTGGTTSPAGQVKVLDGGSLTITATPFAGNVFDHWEIDGGSYTENPITITVSGNNVFVYAFFEATNGGNGGCPYPVEKTVFQGFKLKCEAWEIVKRATAELNKVDTSLLVGGTLNWNATYTQGNEIEVDAHVFLNDQRLDSAMLTHGNPSKSGSVDLAGLIQPSNKVKIAVESLPVTWCEVSFDVWITLCFSSAPATDPEVVDPPPWEDWPWYYWGALGLGAILVLAVFAHARKGIVVRD